MGYQNNWVTLQIGKGYEHWGSGNHIELALSEKGNPYDYNVIIKLWKYSCQLYPWFFGNNI